MPREDTSISVVDLFSGAGGLTLGALRAGFKVVAAVEIDKNAVSTHKRNFPNTKHIAKDINELTAEQLLNEIDEPGNQICGVIGGPPCQGFSAMGQGDVADPRNSLFIKFFEFVKAIQPSFYLAENVPGILNSKYEKIRNEALSGLDGYVNLPAFTVKASEYGAPTTRTRVLFIGYKPDAFQHISLDDFYQQKASIAETVNVSAALYGLNEVLPEKKGATGITPVITEDYAALRKSNHWFYSRVVGLIPEGVGHQEYLDECFTRGLLNGQFPTVHSKKVANRYTALEFRGQDVVSKSVRLDPAGFCPTLRAGTGPERGSYQAVRPIHYAQPRVITPREAARLQGFPDWFSLPDTIWHAFRQIGNSVSPLVAERILSVIHNKLI